jgi:hypothetical protein
MTSASSAEQAASARRPGRRGLLVALGVAAALAVVAVVVVVAATTGGDGAAPARGSSGRSFERVTAGRPVTSLGDLGDVSRPDQLRRRLRAALGGGAGSLPPAAAAESRVARECWRANAPGGRADRPLLVGSATANGSAVDVLAVEDRGRVVAFVVDPRDCAVVGAQSL